MKFRKKDLILGASVFALGSFIFTPYSLAQSSAEQTFTETIGGSTYSFTYECQDRNGNIVPNGDWCIQAPPSASTASDRGTCPPPPPPPPRTGGDGGGGFGDGGGGDGDGDGFDVDGDNRPDYDNYSDAADHVSEHGGSVRGTSDSCSGACDGRSASTGDGDGGGGKVLCTYFHRKGEMNQDDYYAGFAYGLKHAHPATFRGYHFWAVPYAQYLYDNPGGLMEKIMRPIVLRRAQEISYKMGLRDKPDYVGKMIRAIMEPVCFMIGLCVDQKDYSTLYTKEEMKMFRDKYKQHKIQKQAADIVSNYKRFILANS